MMMKKFNTIRNFQRSNMKKDETDSINCYEYNKAGHIKKDCPNLKEKAKRFKKKKKALYVGSDELEPRAPESEEKEETNLNITMETCAS